MKVEMLVLGSYATNCYILIDDKSENDRKPAIVVDPGYDPERVIKKIEKLQLDVQAVIVTHGHFDHTGAVAEVREHTGAKVWASPLDEDIYKHEFITDVEIKDGEYIQVGSMKGKFLHTPGHTQGGYCVYFEKNKMLIVGDTLFRRSVGRSDLQGGDHKQLINSIQTRLMPLPDDTVVLPGHASATTIGEERMQNMFLQG